MPTFCTILVQSKYFRCNTSEPPPMCCKQRTCTIPKSFRCNTYKNRGWGPCGTANPLSRAESRDGCALPLVTEHGSRDTERSHSPYNVRSTSGEHTMHYRKFGRTGWNVSEIGYGMWGLAGWTGSDDAESLDALQRAVDLGCNFFDTAWAYGEGRSEQILGKVLRANAAKKLYVATKIPPKNRKWPSRRDFTLDDCYPPDHIEEYVNKSLANLGVDKLDLIQFHTWEDRWLNDERLSRAVEKLRTSGKAQAVGVSVNRWEPCNGIRAVLEGIADAVQVIYNIFDQNPEDALFPLCRMKNIAVIARVPFDEGTLTGTLTVDSTWPQGDWRNTYFVPENLKSSVARAEALRPLVPAGNSMAQMALRFILNNPDVATIIPGMRKRRNVEANIAASTQGPLPAALQAVELVGNRQRREHRDFLRVHCCRRVRDGVHLFVHVLRERLHIFHI